MKEIVACLVVGIEKNRFLSEVTPVPLLWTLAAGFAENHLFGTRFRAIVRVEIPTYTARLLESAPITC